MLLGLDDIWSASLDPLNLQAGVAVFRADRAPLYFDASAGHRQRAIFRGIRCQLVHSHRQGQHGTRAQNDVLATKDDAIRSTAGIGCKAAGQELTQIRAFPMMNGELIVGF